MKSKHFPRNIAMLLPALLCLTVFAPKSQAAAPVKIKKLREVLVQPMKEGESFRLAYSSDSQRCAGDIEGRKDSLSYDAEFLILKVDENGEALEFELKYLEYDLNTKFVMGVSDERKGRTYKFEKQNGVWTFSARKTGGQEAIELSAHQLMWLESDMVSHRIWPHACALPSAILPPKDPSVGDVWTVAPEKMDFLYEINFLGGTKHTIDPKKAKVECKLEKWDFDEVLISVSFDLPSQNIDPATGFTSDVKVKGKGQVSIDPATGRVLSRGFEGDWTYEAGAAMGFPFNFKGPFSQKATCKPNNPAKEEK